MRAKDIIIWILFLISIAVAFWYFFGNSPTFEQAILVFLLTVLFTLTAKISDIGSEFKMLRRRFDKLEESFIRLADDFKESKRGFNKKKMIYSHALKGRAS